MVGLKNLKKVGEGGTDAAKKGADTAAEAAEKASWARRTLDSTGHGIKHFGKAGVDIAAAPFRATAAVGTGMAKTAHKYPKVAMGGLIAAGTMTGLHMGGVVNLNPSSGGSSGSPATQSTGYQSFFSKTEGGGGGGFDPTATLSGGGGGFDPTATLSGATLGDGFNPTHQNVYDLKLKDDPTGGVPSGPVTYS